MTLGITAMQNKLFFLTGDFSEGQTHKKHPKKKTGKWHVSDAQA